MLQTSVCMMRFIADHSSFLSNTFDGLKRANIIFMFEKLFLVISCLHSV